MISRTSRGPQKSRDIIMPVKAEEDQVPTQSSSSVEQQEEDDVLALLAEEDNKELKRTDPNASMAKASDKGDVKTMKRPVSTYPCPRCNKLGHIEKFCPTLGDPAYDKRLQIQNIPKDKYVKVKTLDNIDTKGKTVSYHASQTFNIRLHVD